jgi:hypothetical protein
LKQAHAIVAAFYYSNPQWFFYRMGLVIGIHPDDAQSVLSVAIACYTDYQSVTIRKAASNAIETATASILSHAAQTYPTVLAKERFIAEKLCDTITYNKSDFIKLFTVHLLLEIVFAMAMLWHLHICATL